VAHLTLVVQGREVRKFVLNPAVTTIGRAQDNDIVINNLALSRRHAEVASKNGKFAVSDLGSQNGVFVNSERIKSARVLNNADTITLGTYHFVFSDQADGDPHIRVEKPRRQEITQLEEPEDPLADEKEPEENAPLLVLKYNDVELQRFTLKNERCLVGRAKDCDVQIAERRLSRRHCEIIRDGDRFILQDLGSQNGTYVNRKRIQGSYGLKHGDVLNFAEYSILYLANVADYDGPDSVHAKHPKQGARPRPDSNIAKEETEFPEAYGEEGESPSPVRSLIAPSDLDEDPDEPVARPPIQARPRQEPLIEEPAHARERRTRNKRPDPEPERAPTPPPRPRKKAKPETGARPEPRRIEPKRIQPKKIELTKEIGPDIDDHGDEVRPDSGLDEWYSAREDESVESYEEPSVLLERSKSSMSQLLSTMMVDKRELDKNLAIRAKERKFFVEVLHGSKKIFTGPLGNAVTILGKDKESDIQLRGRYVAGRHSLLVRVRDSLLLVRLGSSSAARVNGLPKLQAFLKSGDVIQIDETTITITEE
jgi:pSer/pThr/pTyr-binding forkhead associated (FHA) protein